MVGGILAVTYSLFFEYLNHFGKINLKEIRHFLCLKAFLKQTGNIEGLLLLRS